MFKKLSSLGLAVLAVGILATALASPAKAQYYGGYSPYGYGYGYRPYSYYTSPVPQPYPYIYYAPGTIPYRTFYFPQYRVPNYYYGW